MPRRQVTRGNWAESQGQRCCTFRIPGLLRVWRPDSHHDSRDQARALLHPRRRSPLRNGQRYGLDDSYSHENFGREPRCDPTYNAESPLAKPLLFDSWERRRHSLPFEDEDPYSRASVPRAYSDVQPRYEVREPAWAREEERGEVVVVEEEERRERDPGTTTSRYADMGPRFYGRRPHRASDCEDSNDQHECHFAGPAPRASQFPYSHTARPRYSPSDSNLGCYASGRSAYEGCSGHQGRSYHCGVPPPAPDPPFYSPAIGGYDDAQPWQPHVHVGSHVEHGCYYRRGGIDGSIGHDNGCYSDDY